MNIPFMSSDEIIENYKTIKPIVVFNNCPFFLLELTTEEIIEYAYIYLKDFNMQEVDRNTISLLTELNMLHSYTCRGHFQPTIDEVISKIPKDLLNIVVAFEIIKRLGKDYDLEFYSNEFKAGFYVSIVRLYSKKEW